MIGLYDKKGEFVLINVDHIVKVNLKYNHETEKITGATIILSTGYSEHYEFPKNKNVDILKEIKTARRSR